MVVDRGGLSIPFGTSVFEIPHQFAFLGIDTDNRIVEPAEASAQGGNVAELLVAIGVLGSQFLAIDPQGELELTEQSSDRAGTHRNAEPSELCGHIGGSLTHPS